MKSKLLIVLIATMLSSSLAQKDHSETSNRAKRVLASIGTFQLVEHEDLIDMCYKQNIDNVSFLSYAREGNISDHLSGFHSSSMQEVEDIMLRSGGSIEAQLTQLAQLTFRKGALTVVFFAIALVFVIYFVIFAIVNACIKGGLFKSIRSSNSVKPKLAVLGTTLVLGLALLVFLILWFVHYIAIMKNSAIYPCGVGIIMTEAEFGYKYSDNKEDQFIGLRGFDKLLLDTIATVEQFGSLKTAGDALVALDLSTKGDTLKADFTTFLAFDKDTYKVAGAVTPATTEYPDTISLSGVLFGEGLKKEVDALAAIGKAVSSAGQTLSTLAAEEVGNILKTLRDSRDLIAGSAGLKRISTFREAVRDTYSFKKIFSYLMLLLLIVIVFVFLPLMIFMGLLVGNLMGWIKFNIDIAGTGLVICKSIGSLGMSALAVVCLNLSILTVFVCQTTNDVLENKDYHLKLDKPYMASIKSVLRNCVAPGASGNLLDNIDSSKLDQFNKIDRVFEGNAKFEEIRANITSGAPPFVGKVLSDRITSSANLELADSSAAGSNGIEAARMALNSKISCAEDWVMYKGTCTAGTVLSQTGDSASTGASAPYCMQLTTTPSNNYNGRYTLETCLLSELNIHTQIGNLLDAAADHQTKMGSFKTFYEAFFTKETQYLTDLAGSLTNVDQIKTTVSNLKSFVDSLGGNFIKAFDCKVARRPVQIANVAICHRFAVDFVRQTRYLVITAVLVVFTTIMMHLSLIFKFDRISGKVSSASSQEGNKLQLPVTYTEHQPINTSLVQNA